MSISESTEYILFISHSGIFDVTGYISLIVERLLVVERLLIVGRLHIPDVHALKKMGTADHSEVPIIAMPEGIQRL